MHKLLKMMNNMPKGVDLGIIRSSINRRYFLNFKSSSGTLLVTKDKSYLIVDFRYIEKARKVVKNCEVILEDNLYSQISQIIKKHNIKTIGIESYKLTVNEYEKFKDNLANVTILLDDRFNDLINNLRMQKDISEIENMKKAQEIAEKGFVYILGYISKGISEIEVASELEAFLKKNGAQGLSFPTICAFGKNTSLPHAVPSDRKLSSGDCCTLDFGVIYNDYCSDMTRSFLFGNSSEKYKEVYNIVLQAQLAAIEGITAGKSCKDIDDISRKYISDKGYGENFGHGLGHSIGLEVHEPPFFRRNYDFNLQENVVMTVEPGIYIPGEFGVRIEDMVVVKKDGCEIITSCDKNLIIL